MRREMTGAQRRVFQSLNSTPHTPAELKTVLPGRVPVATVRDLLGQLRAMGYATTATSAKHPGVTAWVRSDAGPILAAHGIRARDLTFTGEA